MALVPYFPFCVYVNCGINWEVGSICYLLPWNETPFFKCPVPLWFHSRTVSCPNNIGTSFTAPGFFFFLLQPGWIYIVYNFQNLNKLLSGFWNEHVNEEESFEVWGAVLNLSRMHSWPDHFFFFFNFSHLDTYIEVFLKF